MRKTVTKALIPALLVVAMLLTLVLAGCGESSAAKAQAAPTTPEGILNQALTAATTVNSGTGQFNVEVTVNADPSKVPPEAQAFLAQPISLVGTFSSTAKPLATEFAMTASIAGQKIPVGMKMVDGKAWVQFMDQWYELPPEAMASLNAAGNDLEAYQQKVLQAFKAAGIDMTTWITGLKLVGEEDLNGTKTYHLAGNIDIAKVVADALKISQDKNLQSLVPGAGSMGSTGTSLPMPDPSELQDVQTQLAAMFQNLTVDIWVAKDTYHLLKADLNAKIVPPAEEGVEGINDIALKAGFSLDPQAKPATISAPTNAKPFSELEQSLEGLMGMFSGALGGGMLPSDSTGTGQ